MGDRPAWHAVLIAAERLRCSPWELLERDDGVEWMRIALGAADAEAHAAKQPRPGF